MTTIEFQCNCPGPFGKIRYTMADATRINMYCRHCDTRLVQAEPLSETFAEDELGGAIAPGVAENDESIAGILAREAAARERLRQQPEPERTSNTEKHREKVLTGRRLRINKKRRDRETEKTFVERRQDWEDRMNNEMERDVIRQEHDETPSPVFKLTPQSDPWLRIQYAHGIEYTFDRHELNSDIHEKLERFIASWEQRRNGILRFKARGRVYALNAELVAGIDFEDA